MTRHPSDSCLALSFKFAARCGVVFVWASCLAMLIAPRILVFHEWFQTVSIIKTNSIFVFGCAGTSLWCSISYGPVMSLQYLSRLLALPMALLGSWNLGQAFKLGLLHGTVFQLKQFDYETSAGGSIYALAFLSLGIALILLPTRSTKVARWAQVTALLPASIAVLGICDHIIDPTLSDFQVPVASAALFGSLALGVLLARPEIGLMAPIASGSYGGEMARRLIPTTTIISIAAAWVRYRGEQESYYTSETGVAIFTVVSVMVLIGIIWWTTNSLAKADQARRTAEDIARQQTDQLLLQNLELARELALCKEEVRQLPSQSL